MARLPRVAIAAVLLTACTRLVAGGLEFSAPGYEQTFIDYEAGAVGHATIEEAITEFHSSDDWQLRDDWVTLVQAAATDSLVEFEDERGWVYLIVEFAQPDDTWLVTGYRSCSPPV